MVLEGEGLANDATALILYRFAVAAISTGLFSLPKATGTFAAIVACEILFGLAIGWLSLHARHRTRDPQIEITLSLITPYLAFWIPEHFGGSGVIATVACGLYISWNGPLLISAATRLQGIFFWDLVIFLVEGMLFLLTGSQMRLLYEKSKAFPLQEIVFTTALVVAIVVIARFAWVYPAVYLPRILSKRLRERDPAPSWRVTFVLGFTGVRGAVSLAAALALPLALPGGEGFPYRDMILFVAFGVILITLVGLGSGLPLVVRWLGVAKDSRKEHIAETRIRDRGTARGARCGAEVARCHHRRPRTLRRSRQAAAVAARDPQQPAPGPRSTPPSPRRLGDRHRADARIDWRRAQIHPRAVARRQDHRRNKTTDRTRPRPGRSQPEQSGIPEDAVVAVVSRAAEASHRARAAPYRRGFDRYGDRVDTFPTYEG